MMKIMRILLVTNAYLSERRRKLNVLVDKLNMHFNHKQIYFTSDIRSELLRSNNSYNICLELYYTIPDTHEKIDLSNGYDTFKQCGVSKKIYVAFNDLTALKNELQNFGKNFYLSYKTYLQKRINKNHNLPKKLLPFTIKVFCSMF